MKIPSPLRRWLRPLAGLVAAVVPQVQAYETFTIAHYNFNDAPGTTLASDEYGLANGTLVNGAAFNGSALVLNDGVTVTTAYLAFPPNMLAGLNNVTLEAWVYWTGGPNWQRIWDFGTSNGIAGVHYFTLSPNANGTQLRFTVSTNSNNPGAETTISAPLLPQNQWVHVAVSYDYDARLATLYMNGNRVAYGTVNIPLNAIQNTNNWLGRAQYAADPYFRGQFDEFRIHNVALRPAQVAASYANATLFGTDYNDVDPGALTAIRLVTTNLFAWRAAQLAVLADFEFPANVDVTVNEGVLYTSSDTNLITVSTNGVVQAMAGTGSATITAVYTYKDVTRSNSQVITIQSPDNPTLVHRYSFNDTATPVIKDSVGTADGLVTNLYNLDLTTTNILQDGSKLTLLQSGTNFAYVDLPNGLVSSLNEASFEMWVVLSNTPSWARVFDFGNSITGEGVPGVGSNYLFLAAQYPARVAYKVAGATSEALAMNTSAAFVQGALTHVVCTYNYANGMARMYVNGRLVTSGVPPAPLSQLQDVNNWLGRSQYSADAFFKGDYLEFRIYQGSMSPGDVAASYAAGPDALPGTPPGTEQSLALAANPSMFGSQQAQVLLTYQNGTVADIAASSEVAYQSSDSNVLAVSSTGLLLGRRSGTATVTVSYHGFTDSKTVTVDMGGAPLVHRYAFNEVSGTNAVDAIGTAHGTLYPGASFSGAGTVVLNGSGGFVDLPNGIITSLTNATFEAWVTVAGSGNWQRVFDFGSSTAGDGYAGSGVGYLAMIARSGNTGNPTSVNLRRGGDSVDLFTIASPAALALNSQAHLVLVFDYENKLARYYVNGQYVGYAVITLPLQGISDVNNWIGRSQWSADSFLNGQIADFRIYNRALSAKEVAANKVAGPEGALLPDLGAPTALRLAVTNTLFQWRQSAQISVVADYGSVTNVDVTVGEGVVYTSSDPSVLSVNSYGAVLPVASGTATITATFGALSDTKTVTVVTVAPVAAGSLYVDLRATNASVTTASWINESPASLGNFAKSGNPLMNFVSVANYTANFPGVLFNGTADWFIGPVASADLIGNSDRSVEAWICNPAMVAEETAVSWGVRGTTRLNSSFNYGNSTSWGAFGFYGDDVGWPSASIPAANVWHHIVWTYNGARLATVYVDGVQVTSKTLAGDLATGSYSINIAVQRANATTVNNAPLSGYINSVRVHGGTLTAANVATNYLAGPVLIGARLIEVGASDVLADRAVLKGNLATMTAPTDVTVFLGTADGGSNSAAWATNYPLGKIPFGLFGTNVTGLNPATTYYYRSYASNQYAQVWSGVMSFTTAGGPVVTNRAVDTLTPGYARLGGSVLATNLYPTQVRVYWGPTDGGTTIGNWSNVVDLGVQPVGDLRAKISGLASGTTYYYRYYGVNAMGEAWASATASFVAPQSFQPAGYAYVMTNAFPGYTLAETLTNFPALVVLNTNIPGFSYGQFLSGNADLRFVEANGKELNYEVESWNTNGPSYVWLQLPEFRAGTTVQMFWGKAGISLPAYRTNGATWSEGYLGVWHLNADAKDSVGTYNGTVIGSNVRYTNSMMGNGLIFNGTDNYVDLPDGMSNFASGITVEAWANLYANANWARIVDFGNGAPNNNIVLSRRGTANADIRWEFQNTVSGTKTLDLTVSGGFPIGTWKYWAATEEGMVNQARAIFFVNGAEVGRSSAFAAPGSVVRTNNFIGKSNWADALYNGLMDEVRISAVARSSNWLAACYNNQANIGTFQSFGTVVTRPLPLTFTSPAVTNIDTTTAGAALRVIADGGNGIAAWGTVWGTAPAPVDNITIQSGATVPPLDLAVGFTGLTPGGHYYVRGFASNSAEGLVYSPTTEFYTEPLAASAVTFGNVSNRTMTISWTPGTGSAGSLVVVREAATVAAAPLDGVIPTANTRIGFGADLGGGAYVVYCGTGTSVSVWDLKKNTPYHVAVYAYAGEGAAINYQQDAPAVASQTMGNALVVETAGQLLVDVAVSRGLQLAAGGYVTNWLNYGSVGGGFATDGALGTSPSYEAAAGVPALSFDGSRRLRASFAAPSPITGNGSYTVEYWVMNPSVANEEWVFAWSRRGTDSRFASVGYGTNATWGLAAHWGAPDMAFGEGVSTPGLAATPAVGAWHHIAVVYDGGVERAYVDGVLNAQEAKILNIWPGDPVTLGAPYTLDTGTGVITYTSGINYSGYLAAVRVHSGVLTPGQIQDNYGIGAVPPTPANLLASPADAVVTEYGSASFRVAVAGTMPISYQWYCNGVGLADATNAAYTLTSALMADDGAQFLCVASNVVDGTSYTVTSAVARLTVINASASLTHRYSFTTDASDSVGTAHGTLQGAAVIADGAVALNGTAGTFVNLPGGLITGYTNLTIEFWASFGANGAWNRVFDFGDQTASAIGRYYVMFSSHSGVPDMRMSYSDADPGYNHEVVAATGGTLDGVTNVHVVCVFEPSANSMRMYLNGLLVTSNTLAFPLSSIQNVYSYVGRSLYGGDSPMNGSIDEFRIYNAALSSAKVMQSYQQGPNVALADTNILVAVEPTSQTNILGTPTRFEFRAASIYPMSFQWYFNGLPLDGQTANTLLIPSSQYSHQGNYQAVAVCPLGSLTSVVATLTVNQAPVPGQGGSLQTTENQPVSFAIAKWLRDASDPDGDVFDFTVAAASTNGAAVTLAAGILTYTPVPGFTGQDRFSYTLRDSRGGQTVVWVSVIVTPANGPAPNQLALDVIGADVRVRFAGIPGRTYEIQRASVVLGPWTPVHTMVCPNNGIMEFLDVGGAPASFYRTVAPAP